MRPSRLVVVSAAALAAVAACSGAQPCPTCPDLAGTWSLTWADAGLTPNCTAQGPRPATLTFAQNRSDLSTVLEGHELKGTILDTWDFTLHGGDTSVTYALRGRALAEGTDGGVRIDGTLTTLGECTVDDRFVAKKP